VVFTIIEQKCGHDFRIKALRDSAGNVALSVEIDELMPALWLQFAFAVAEDKQYRRCAVCDRAFELAPGENRADRRFCSDRCRIRAYRQRKAQACEMRTAGKHLREIAKEFDTDVATVKGWVGEA
jgi:predicted nucleic acid-binding Zn ribbon protein